jgi:quinol monooxygenase YgiN
LAFLATTGTTAATFLALPRTMTATPPPPVFSLLVTLQFTADEPLRQFLVDIAPLCQYVHDHEPDTIAYQVLHSDIDPLRVLILERYRDKENAFLTIHRHSIPFLEFRPKLQAMQEAGHVTVQGESYLDSGTQVGGFGDRVVVDAAAP